MRKTHFDIAMKALDEIATFKVQVYNGTFYTEAAYLRSVADAALRRIRKESESSRAKSARHK
jgi:hypothetical protein